MLRRQILAGLLLMAACLARADEPSGREILDRVENLLWAKTLQGRYEMSIVTPRWQRTTWSRKAGILDDYTHKVVATSPVGGEPAWQVEATPKPDAAVVWGRVLYRVRQGDSMPPRSTSTSATSWCGCWRFPMCTASVAGAFPRAGR